MVDSILNSTKKVLGIDTSYTVFDTDIIMYINSAFATLHQLGIGPLHGFAIEDSTTEWDAFLRGDNRLNSAKEYVAKKVRLAFDPPPNSFTIQAIQESLKEIEWRLNVVREGVVYGVPLGDTGSTGGVFDGGDPTSSLVGSEVFDGGAP